MIKDNAKEIPYVDSLPSHWNLIPNKFIFFYDGYKVGQNAGSYQLLSLTTQGVKIKDINSVGGKVPISYETYQTVKKGQIVFCLFDLDCSAVFAGISNYDGMITSAYDVFSVKDIMLAQYGDYWFQYVFSNRYYKLFSKNIRYTITNEVFGALKTPVPPVREQQFIADFLDKKCAEIDRLITHEEAMIDELKAYKQSVITEAVTKGLDRTAPMKDSGVEWIGEIPLSWQICKLTYVCSIVTDFVASGSFSDLKNNVQYLDEPDYAMLVRTTDLSGSSRSENKVYINEDAYKFLNNSNLFGGEIILPNIGASCGDVYIVPKLYEKMSLAPNAIMFKTKYNDKYFYYFFKSKCGREMLQDLCASTAQQKFNKTELRLLRVPLVPLAEQNMIVSYLDKRCAAIDSLQSIKQQKIDELKAYKKSLIYEYVTGKKEVV